MRLTPLVAVPGSTDRCKSRGVLGSGDERLQTCIVLPCGLARHHDDHVDVLGESPEHPERLRQAAPALEHCAYTSVGAAVGHASQHLSDPEVLLDVRHRNPRRACDTGRSGGKRFRRVAQRESHRIGSALGAPGVRPSVSGLAGGAPRLLLHRERRGVPLRKPLVRRSPRVAPPTLPQ